MLPGLRFRQDYYDDPKGWTALVDLLQDTFGIDVGLQMRMGGYDTTCMPFGWFDADGVLVANLSAFSMPMQINGVTVTGAAFQSGAVRPAFQGKGLYRDVMRKAFGWSDAEGFDFGILLTDKPAMYEPYGFETVPQMVFSGHVGQAPQRPSATRTLCLENPQDLALLQEKLRQRSPVSDRFAVLAQREMFLLNAAFDASIRLVWCEALDTVAAFRLDDTGGLHLLDLVASSIPNLASLLNELPVEPGRVSVYFPPDKLQADLQPEPYHGTCALMIRGDLAQKLDKPVILSPMAEF